MKNLVRAFALSLVVTGAVATLHASNNTATALTMSTNAKMPVPTCPPDDPNGCNIGQNGR